jgi:site-specific DNA recombinase
MTNNCFIYCRKSTDTADKQEQSLETQERICLETAKRFNLNVSEVILESKSAKDAGNRPKFDELISHIRNKEAGIIITWDIDRLARNLTEAGLLQSLYETGFIQKIITEHDIYQSDRDFMNIGHEFVDASNYSRKLKSKVKDGTDTKLKNGGIPGSVKVGYCTVDKKFKPDPDRSPFVKLAFVMYAEGNSLRDITDKLYELGFRSKHGIKVHSSSIAELLKRIDYTGVFLYDKNLYQGCYDAIISMELFDKVQKLIVKNNIPKSKKHWFLYRGFIKCSDCGCMHTATTKKGKYIYYYCTNSRRVCKQHEKYIDEEKMHTLYSNKLSELPIDVETLNQSYDLYAKSYLERYKDVENQKNLVRKQLGNVETRIKRVVDLYIDENIQQDVYNQKYKELLLEKETLENSLKKLETQKPEQTLELVKKFKDYCCTLQNLYSEGDNEVKEEILKAVCWNFSINNGEIASIQYKKPFDLIAKLPKNADFVDWWTVAESNRRSLQCECSALPTELTALK